MKRFSILLVLVAASLVAAGPPAHAGERPIQAEGRGFLYLNGDSSAYLLGSGKSEHLGQCYLFSGLDVFQLFDGNAANVVPQYFELGAANGDRLTATVESEFDPKTGIVAGTITFAGGSGRFAVASGSARLFIVPDTSWFDYSNGFPYPIERTQFSWALEGTIDY